MNMRSIEIFSGAGGLALGLEEAGFESVALLEKDARACAALKFNRPDWNIIEADVREIDYHSFGPIDLVAGGPPCQPFSMGGKARSFDDTRDMFPEAVRAVRELHPNAFIFENVRGLMRSAFSDYVEFIRLQLTYPQFPVSANTDWETNLRRLQRHHTSAPPPNSELRYNVAINLVDAANYGVPQRRHRVFFIGIRGDLVAKWSFPKPTHSREELIRSMFVTNEYFKRHRMRPLAPDPRIAVKIDKLRCMELLPQHLPWRTVRDAISDVADLHASGTVSNHILQPGARSYPGHTGSPYDEPSKALKAGDHGVPGGENMLKFRNGKVRYFTIRECARIQTFPDDFVFPGSWTDSMRQLGNAVPVRLARVVASSVARKIGIEANSKACPPRSSVVSRDNVRQRTA